MCVCVYLHSSSPRCLLWLTGFRLVYKCHYPTFTVQSARGYAAVCACATHACTTHACMTPPCINMDENETCCQLYICLQGGIYCVLDRLKKLYACLCLFVYWHLSVCYFPTAPTSESRGHPSITVLKKRSMLSCVMRWNAALERLVCTMLNLSARVNEIQCVGAAMCIHTYHVCRRS